MTPVYQFSVYSWHFWAAPLSLAAAAVVGYLIGEVS